MIYIFTAIRIIKERPKDKWLGAETDSRPWGTALTYLEALSYIAGCYKFLRTMGYQYIVIEKVKYGTMRYDLHPVWLKLEPKKLVKLDKPPGNLQNIIAWAVG